MIKCIKLLLTFMEFVVQIVEIFPSVVPDKILKQCVQVIISNKCTLLVTYNC
jgi:hypothetical protein